MKASAQACFADYMRTAGANDLAEIARFCGVKAETVLTWRDGRVWPRGDAQYTLWAYLDLHGYQIDELERLPRPTHQLVLIIAIGLVTFKDVQEQLGYADLQSVYRLVREGGSLLPNKASRLEALVNKHLEELNRYQADFSVADGEAASYAEPPEGSPKALSGERSSDEVRTAARLLKIAVRRAAGVNQDELGSEIKTQLSQEQLESFALFLLELV